LLEMKDIPYQNVMGISMYAMVATRTDLANALDGHEENHVILEGHLRYEVAHWWQIYINLKIYSNANWARDVKNRRSTSKYVVFVGEDVVSWNSE
jgi:hypothetical protein